MIVHNKTGGRTIELFIPFDHGGKKIESITFAPFRLGHAMRWSAGDWKTSIELMVELAGVDESVILDLRYPDADRVMSVFMDMLTPPIRDDIIAGNIPLKQHAYNLPPLDEEEPAATNGSGEPLGPGVPIPDTIDQGGFDMSEEP